MNAILLAGGESSRFGSNKALARIKGQTMIYYILSSLKKVYSKIYIIGDKKEYSFLQNSGKIRIKEDIIPEKGPLGGLYTGLKYSSADYNVLVGCDMPLLTENYFRFLKNYNKKTSYKVSGFPPSRE